MTKTGSMRALAGCPFLLAAFATAIPEADACSHRCDVPFPAVVMPRDSTVVPASTQIVVHWRGRQPNAEDFAAYRDEIFLESDTGVRLEVTYANESWANGLATTLLLSPVEPLPEGVYHIVSGLTPNHSQSLLSTFTVGTVDVPETLDAVPVEISEIKECANTHERAPACCYGEDRDFRRIDLGIAEDSAPVFSILDGDSVVASHLVFPDIWGVALNSGVQVEDCDATYSPWHITRELHHLRIVPFSVDGAAQGPLAVDVDARDPSGGCSIGPGGAHLSLDQRALPLLFIGAIFVLRQRRCRELTGGG